MWCFRRRKKNNVPFVSLLYNPSEVFCNINTILYNCLALNGRILQFGEKKLLSVTVGWKPCMSETATFQEMGKKKKDLVNTFHWFNIYKTHRHI